LKPNWFVGIPVPAEQWLPDMLRSLPSCCRGFASEDVHMTVAFLGAMDPSLAIRISALMDEIAFTPFEIGFAGVVPLPSARRASALSLELEAGREAAVAVLSRWRDPLIAVAGGRPDTRAPLPHVTIARPIRRHGPQAVAQACAWARAVTPPIQKLQLDRLALYTWADDRREHQFRIVDERRMTA